MQNHLELIARQLQQVFDGEPWYGPSVMETLELISEAQANMLVQDKRIAGLVRHMTAWRNFALQKLKGNDAYDIDASTDWPAADGTTWLETIQALEKSQQQLLSALKKMPGTKLAEKVPGRNYSFAAMLEGLVQHDIYHLGQIGLLNKLVAPKD